VLQATCGRGVCQFAARYVLAREEQAECACQLPDLWVGM
jgi:hypothetical protein